MNSELGSKLRLLRQAKGWSVAEAAEEANIGRKTLSRWEHGQTLPRVPELEKLLEALDASVEQKRDCLLLLNAPRAIERLSELDRYQDLNICAPHGGDLLRAMRVRRNWSQERLAAVLDVAQSTVARWERNDAWPENKTLHNLCYHLHAHEEELQALAGGALCAFLGNRNANTTLILEVVEENCRQVRTLLQDPRFYRLSDLYYLALQAQAAHLAAKSEAGRLLLARILLWQADIYGERGQAQEAARMAERAFPLLPTDRNDFNDLRLKAEIYHMVAGGISSIMRER